LIYERNRKLTKFASRYTSWQHECSASQNGDEAGKEFLLEYAVIAVQHAFRAEHRKEPPCKQSNLRWYRQFKDTGFLQLVQQLKPEVYDKI
jgi:hypothetical protein